MFDINDEINNYIKIINEQNYIECNDINTKIDVVTKHIKKINKLENDVFNLMKLDIKGGELILNKISNNENYLSIIDEIKLQSRIQDDREKKLISALVNIVDSIDWLIEKDIILENKAGMKSIEATKKIIEKELFKINIFKMGNVGDIYDEEEHICLGYKNGQEKDFNEIIEVVKKGYKYKDKILRQAEVIVVKNNLEDNYEYSGN